MPRIFTSTMLLNRGLIALAASVAIPICSANDVFPGGRLAAVDIPAAAGIFDITVNISNRPDAVPQPRLRLPAIPLQEHLNSFEASPAQVKRTLLGARGTCEEDYRYCHAAGGCCPDDSGDGGCCDDGTCVTTGVDTCCKSGGACGAGKDCCSDGCKPQANECCIGGGSCKPHHDCCGTDTCSPKGGDCCADGSVCDTGLVCVTLNGVLGCCIDHTCSEFQGGGTGENINNGSGSGSFTPAGPRPAGWAWAMTLTGAAVVLGAGMVLL